MPVLAAERLVKCPTEHCPGWITLDDGRPQTVPCRYCRITTHTLAFLLGQIGEHEAPGVTLDLWSPRLHERFNDLMLALGGAVRSNVYIRPMDRVIATRIPGRHGEALEYNSGIASVVGAGPIVGLLLHELLHFDLHAQDERPLEINFKQGVRDKEQINFALRYLPFLVDHLWLAPQTDAIAPNLRASMQEWGLDIALLLSGNESFFVSYIDERNRRWLVETLQQLGDPAAMREQSIERLAELMNRFYGHNRDPLLPRALVAAQLADLKLHNPDAATQYVARLVAHEFPGSAEAETSAARIAADLADVRSSAPDRPSTTDFRRATEAVIKGLNLQNSVEVVGQKK